MRYKNYISGLLIVLLCSFSMAIAQEATEVYIPIGESPGLSGKYTTIGTVQSTDYAQNTLTIADSADTITVRITEKTKIYLDKSQMNKRNEYGKLKDCTPGKLIEVKYKDNERKEDAIADWIKIEMK